jgi:hypothetical protein
MRILKDCVVVLALMSMAQVGTSQDNPAQTRLDRLVERLARGEVLSAEILHMPSDIETLNRMTPPMLDGSYSAKVTIRDVRVSRLGRRLTEAMKSLHVRPGAEMADVRWGVVFYDSKRVRIGSIYFNGRGDVGSVDDLPVSFSGTMFGWVNRTFSSSLQ